jgi:hypothetical protein
MWYIYHDMRMNVLNYRDFLLEAELAHPRGLADKIKAEWNKTYKAAEGKETDTTGFWTAYNVSCEFNRSLECGAGEVLYDKFKVRLGCAALRRLGQGGFVMGEGLAGEIGESVRQGRLVAGLTRALEDSRLQVDYMPTLSVRSSGSLATYEAGYALTGKDHVLRAAMKLSNTRDSVAEVDSTIRHELQHFTQMVNSLCLAVGELLAGPGDGPAVGDYRQRVWGIYQRVVDRDKVFGGGRTRTGLRQSDEVANYDPVTGKPTRLHKMLGMDLSDQANRRYAAAWQYLMDDSEYKPWVTDKVEEFIARLDKEDPAWFRAQAASWALQRLARSAGGGHGNDERKGLVAMARKAGMTYMQAKRAVDAFSLNDLAVRLARRLIEGDEVMRTLMANRRETGTDVCKLMEERLRVAFDRAAGQSQS